jgi:hypothetical protein
MTPAKKSMTIAAAWFVLGVVMAVAALLVDLSLNLFDWHGRFSAALVVACVVFCSAAGATLYLHRETRGALPMLMAVLVTLCLAALGAVHLAAEPANPGAFLGRTRSSPLWYRLAFAAALALPALLLGARRWRTDESDLALARRAPRWAPPLATLGLALIALGVAGRRASDPAPYQRALDVLGGPSALEAIFEVGVAAGKAFGQASSLEELLVPEILEQRMREHASTPPGTREAEHHDRLERFLASEAVPEAMKLEVRTLCAEHLATHPVRAHTCARDALVAARRRAERRRQRFGWVAALGIPAAAAALALGWRARRPAAA